MEKQNGCEFAVKMLRLNDSLLMGKNDLSANESAIVTEDMTWEEFEDKNQELLRQRYENNIGFRVFEKECPHCGRIFYTLTYFRKYCHLSNCRDAAKQRRNEQRKQEHHSEHICSVCGSSFISKRTDAKFCSNACRQKAYRINAEAK